MTRWLVFAALTLSVCGCNSVGRPKGEAQAQAKEEKQENARRRARNAGVSSSLGD
jgi:Flp pilus assembly protein TadD